MGQNKEDWIGATDGMFASPGEKEARLRLRALADKAKARQLSADEKADMRRLADSISDNAEFEE